VHGLMQIDQKLLAYKLKFKIKNPLIECFKYTNTKRLFQLYLTVFLMLISAIFEVITIGSIVPLVASIIGGSIPSFISNFLNFLLAGVDIFKLDSPNFLIQILTVFTLLIVLSTFLRLIAQYSIIKLTNDLGFDLTNRAYSNVLQQGYQFHVGTNSSEIIAAMNKVQSITGGAIMPVLQSISSAIMAIGIVLFLMMIDWKVAVIVFISLAITYLVISYLVQRKLATNSITIAKAHSDRIKSVNEALGNMRELILGDRQAKHYHSFLETETALNDSSIENGFISSAPKVIIEGMGISILLFAAFFLTSSGSTPIDVLPTIAAFAFATQKLLPAVQTLFYAWSKVSGSVKSIKDTLSFLTLPISEKKGVRTEDYEFKKLSFENVCFHYNNGFEVLKDVNIEIFTGKVIGIVGETGSGKSTFVDLLSQLIYPTSGKISLTGVNGQELSQSDWQSNIGYVPQNPYFLDESILVNISLNDERGDIDMTKMRSVIDVAQLSKVIDELELGINTIIGERGAKLSGGQLQRIAIARALYAEKQVLIFDEATSALDQVTERLVLSSLKREFFDKTVILITHRPQTMEFCNKIFKVENKRIKQIK
jgi:ATP-binding cassette, subfamily B, bacterial PglK